MKPIRTFLRRDLYRLVYKYSYEARKEGIDVNYAFKDCRKKYGGNGLKSLLKFRLNRTRFEDIILQHSNRDYAYCHPGIISIRIWKENKYEIYQTCYYSKSGDFRLNCFQTETNNVKSVVDDIEIIIGAKLDKITLAKLKNIKTVKELKALECDFVFVDDNRRG